jgi:hypothetical protein
MKPNQDPESDKALRNLLHSWVVDTPLPPRFQEQVWRRIERAELRPQSPFWAAVFHLVEVALPRPKVAFVYVSLLLALGVGAGTWAAQVKTNRTEAELGYRYVQSIDPYQATHP